MATRTAFRMAAPAALSALFAAAFFLLSSLPAEDPFADCAARLAKASAEVNRRLFERQPPRGAPLEGNAWDYYACAAEALLTPSPAGLADPSGEDLEEESDLFCYAAANSEAFDMLRRGVRCGACSATINYAAGYSAHAGPVSSAAGLAALLFYNSRLAERGGRRVEAARILSDAAFFGQDLARNGTLGHLDASCGMEIESLKRLAALADRAEFRKDELAEISGELAVLERCRPPIELSASSELLMLAGEIVNQSRGRGAYRIAGVSDRMLLDSLARAGTLFADFYGASALPFRDAFRESDAIDSRLDEMKDPVLDACGIGFSRHAEAMGTASAICRALAFAFSLACAEPGERGGLAPPEDPFSGAPMRFFETGGGLVVYSMGPDMKDGGGESATEWNPDEPDLVLRFAKLASGAGR